MAYTKYEPIGFENGILETPGSVNLETGEMTMPVYSGKAPVNATNLNHVEEGLTNLETYMLENEASSGSLPYGAIVEYDGTEVPVGYEKVETEFVLFSGDSNENITLSDRAENYKDFEIYGRSNDGQEHQVYTKVISPNGKYSYLRYEINITGTTYVKYTRLYINGNTIELSNGVEYYFNMGSSNTINGSLSNNIYITKVIGHK